MRQRITYYAAGLAACTLGMVCFNSALSNSKVVLASIVLLALGFSMSWMVRARLLHKSRAETLVLVLLLLLLSVVLSVRDFRDVILPEEVTSATDMFMGVMLIWMMIACSFRLSNDRSVLFMCVPALSLIGLTATFDPNTALLTVFGLFLALACFILIRQNTFSYQEQPEESEGTLKLSTGSMRLHIGITASVTLVALVVGIALGTLLYPALVKAFTRQMSPFDTTQFVEQLVGEEYVPVATGPVDLSNQELMTVKCDRYMLWRGRTYNKYTGQGWVSELSPGEQVRIRPVENRNADYRRVAARTFILPRHPLYETSKVSERVEQTFTVVSNYFNTVFGASQPRIIKFHGPEPMLVFGSRIEAVSAYGPKASYTVVSRTNTATPRQLSGASQEYPQIILSRYTGVPDTCWQVQKLTDRVTAGERNAYRRALAIQNYLEGSFAYDTSAPAAPDNEDAVTFFLLKSKRGYCDIFASSMVIMARQAGIPARWVTGFAPGEIKPEDGLYHILAKDRHAWAELYFPSYGWIEFDATPSVGNKTWASRVRDIWALIAADKTTVIVIGVVFFLLGYLIKTEVIDRLRRQRRRTPTQQEVCAAEVSRNYRRMCDILGRAGYPRQPSSTPWEYVRRLDDIFGQGLEELSQAVDAITADFVEFRYSPREPSPDRLSDMSRSVQSLAKSIKLARKQNLLAQNKHS